MKSSLNCKESLLVFLSTEIDDVLEKMLHLLLGSRINLSNFTCGLSVLVSYIILGEIYWFRLFCRFSNNKLYIFSFDNELTFDSEFSHNLFNLRVCFSWAFYYRAIKLLYLILSEMLCTLRLWISLAFLVGSSS